MASFFPMLQFPMRILRFWNLMADPSPPIRPKFNLGGQVSHYSSNPQIVTALNHETSTDDPEAGSKVKSSSNNTIENMSSNRNNRSLNPELLMREFTQDEQGRIDSLGVTDSPSACFQSQFAREVVQNTRKSSSILNLDLPSEPKSSASVHPAPALTHNHHNSNSQDNLQQTSSLNSNSNQQHRTRRNGSYLSSNNPKYRSQFAAKHHQVRIFFKKIITKYNFWKWRRQEYFSNDLMVNPRNLVF